MICKDDYFRQAFPFASRLNIPAFECTQEGVSSLVDYLRTNYRFHIMNAFINEGGVIFVVVDPVKRQGNEREWLIEVFRWCMLDVKKVIVMN
tara:strand:+ start:608 stop:883 length:276 start_codon:yes stop_codon:yes gene_type:complete